MGCKGSAVQICPSRPLPNPKTVRGLSSIWPHNLAARCRLRNDRLCERCANFPGFLEFLECVLQNFRSGGEVSGGCADAGMSKSRRSKGSCTVNSRRSLHLHDRLERGGRGRTVGFTALLAGPARSRRPRRRITLATCPAVARGVLGLS